MPIGKNAIKRVSSSTGAQVNAQAVDAVVSEPKVEEKVAPKAAPKTTAPKKTTAKAAPKTAPKAAAPKTAPKKAAPKKSMEKEPDFSPVKTAEKVVKKSVKAPKNEGISHFYLGDELPYYLL